jgi:hypothetical protein
MVRLLLMPGSHERSQAHSRDHPEPFTVAPAAAGGRPLADTVAPSAALSAAGPRSEPGAFAGRSAFAEAATHPDAAQIRALDAA